MTNNPAPSPELSDALRLMRLGDLSEAGELVQKFLQQQPGDLFAMRMLADIYVRLGQLDAHALT